MLAFHFNVLTAGSIHIAAEAELVEIYKQQNQCAFLGMAQPTEAH